jgi:hypothetical protein
MNEARELAPAVADALELLSQEVLDGLDVVIGLRLECFDPRRIVHAEPVDDSVQNIFLRRLERRQLGDCRLVREMLEPAHLDQRSVADQRVFGEVLAQRRGLARIPSVERRKCEKRR